ncbi:MAG: hybrid sensor histidine kinase/response regulator [Candidatus Viridilinea halotolerans]|uniref:Circadian input-output histidine kinase CikA n=1 Tax=Candidatus Viridilinea halotolerans TaxID=2491704 RepID=A0A426TWU7_9CHLR|nr:MAG: hybrid sensor histidine kinase/response regulator [Candidatus Viridilinea halotolerans]
MNNHHVYNIKTPLLLLDRALGIVEIDARFAALLPEQHGNLLGQPVATCLPELEPPLCAWLTQGQAPGLLLLTSLPSAPITISVAPVLASQGTIMAVEIFAEQDGGRYHATQAFCRTCVAQQHFLLQLNDRLRPLVAPQEVQNVALLMLAEYLQVDRAMYGEVEAGNDEIFIIRQEHRRTAVPSIVGYHRFDEFGPDVAAHLRQGQTLVSNDVQRITGNSASHHAAHTLVGVRAHISVPLVKEGRILAYLAVNQQTPRNWTAQEIQLVQEVASRTWETVERAHTEAMLRQTNLELIHTARAKDEFMANMSHELRTPLNAILAFSESLQEGVAGPVNERQISALRHIETSGQHLLALINDVLDLAKVEAGRVELQFERFAINDLCRSSFQLIKEQALKKQQQIRLTLNDEAAYLEADPRRLKQILVNLLSNAVKFTPNQGQISLEVEVLPEVQLVQFHVRDSGIGIDAASLDKLFKPFTQLDAALNRQHEGTGLGLALVHSLAQLHGGNVTVESQVGVGSCFTLMLPYYPPALPEVATAPSATASHAITPDLAKLLDGVKILLAEDNEINLTVVSNYLQAHGCHVIAAQTGRQALSQAAACQPDMILMDVQMPELDGISAIKLLRANPTFQQTPIIVLSALAMKGDRERCLAAGADAYMAKPLRMRELVGLMRSLLERSAEK